MLNVSGAQSKNILYVPLPKILAAILKNLPGQNEQMRLLVPETQSRNLTTKTDIVVYDVRMKAQGKSEVAPQADDVF